MAKLEQRTGSGRERKKLGLAPGGFLAPKHGPPVGVKLKNKLNRAGDAISRKVDVIASNAATKKRNRQEEKSSRITEEPTLTINTSDTTIGRDTSPSASDRFNEIVLGQPIANPNIYAANLAGGSRPMTAMDNPQIDPVTGMPITPGGQPNMNPNFIGGMANSNMPTTGMLAQEKSVLENLKEFGKNVMSDLHKADSLTSNMIDKAALKVGILNEDEYRKREMINKRQTKTPQDKKMKDYLLTGITVDADVEARNPMNVIGPNKDLANFKPTTVKPDSDKPGIEREQSPESVVANYKMGGPGVNEFRDAKLDEIKRNSKPQYGTQANRDQRFIDTLKKRSAALGIPDPVDSVLNQDKTMPKGVAGKGIRSLPSNVQEKMGYDPLSQQRYKIGQDKKERKSMRVKRGK